MRCLRCAILVVSLLALPGSVAAYPSRTIANEPDDRINLLNDLAMHSRWPIPPEAPTTNLRNLQGIGAEAIWDLFPLPPSMPRHSHSLVYDSRRDRLVLFGG